MIRKTAWIVTSSLLAALALAGTPAVAETQRNPIQPPAAPATVEVGPTTLVPSSGHTTLIYDLSLTPAQVQARAAGDAEALGFELFKTLAIANMVVLEAPAEEVAGRLRTVEGLPVTALAPSYQRNGDRHPDSMIAFTSRMALRFSEDATEAAKADFLAARGYQRLMETPTGYVIVETGREPNAGMIEYASDLEGGHSLVEEAIYEYVMTGEPTSRSDSIEVNARFFSSQWWLANDGDNTFFPGTMREEDTDAPLAWMINQRNQRDRGEDPSDRRFGDAVVGILDAGVDFNHADLAPSMDPRLGRDFIDGGNPFPVLNALNAHGTFLAGLIASRPEGRGIAGIAPGAKIYAIRVFAGDYSTTNLRVLSGLQESVAANVDVNVHAYALPIDLQCGLSSSIETGLRETFEAGRFGIGIANFAAAGNFHSQVSYPGSSAWTITVGAVDSFGNRIANAGFGEALGDTNWGGNGIDMVMPSYQGAQDTALSLYATGIFSTDISGAGGLSSTNYGLVGDLPFSPGPGIGTSSQLTPANPTVAYCPDGNTVSSRPFMGTSPATALAAGAAALLLSDPRYEALPPITDPFVRPGTATRRLPRSREEYRQRISHGSDNLARRMAASADLPGERRAIAGALGNRNQMVALGGPLAYIDQYNEFLGYGRPNPAKALAQPDAWPTEDSFFTGLLRPNPIYQVQFGMYAPLGTEQDPDMAEILRQGWTEHVDFNIALPIGPPVESEDPDEPASDEPTDVIISPYMEPRTAIYFEDGTVLEVNTDGEDDLFPYAWTDSLPLAMEDENVDDDDRPINLYWNPEGRYQANQVIGLVSPSITNREPGVPMLMEVQIGHQLGTQNASSDTQVGREIDSITFDIVYADEEGDLVRTEVARLTGDSRPGYKNRLVSGQFASLTDDEDEDGNPLPPLRMFWGNEPPYRPWLPPEGAEQALLVRNYRFYVPPLSPLVGSFTVEMRLNPGPSYLPTYNNEPDPDDFEQLLSVTRDHLGFVFTGLQIHALRNDYIAYLNRQLFELSDGFFPTWSPTAEKLYVFQNLFGLPGKALTVVSPHPPALYLDPADAGEFDEEGPSFFDRINPTTYRDRQNLRFMDTIDRVTGMKAHPTRAYIAVTTQGGEGDRLNLVTTDGINFGPMIPSSQSVGARDPFWTADGNFLLFSSNNYIRALVLDDDFNVLEVETPVSSVTSFLRDFRSPVMTREGGMIFFTARRADAGAEDRSLQLYAATRTGRVVSYRENMRDPLLPGWEGMDIYDLELSRSGRRLLFSANAQSAPVPGITGSAPVLAPAVASPNSRLYTIDNFHHVWEYNDEPFYNRVTFRETDPSFPKVSGRYARLSPANPNEIAWMAYPTTIGPDDISSEARIIRQSLATGEFTGPPTTEITPTPKPDVPPPTVTPAPPDNSRVTLLSAGNFAIDNEGWSFGDSAGALDPPANRYVKEDGRPALVQPGLVAFSSAANGPVANQNVRVATLTFRAINTGTASLRFETAPPHASQLLDSVLSVLPAEFDDNSVDIRNPGKVTGDPPRLFFTFPHGRDVIRDEEFTVEVRMDGNGGTAQHLDLFLAFDKDLLQFRHGSFNTTIFHQAVRGSLELVSQDSNFTFGYYGTRRGKLVVDTDALYLFRGFVRAVSETNDRSRFPALRLRANSLNFESSFEALTQSTGSDFTLVPVTERVRPYDLLFRPPAEHYHIPDSNRGLARGGLFATPVTNHAYTLFFDLINTMEGDDPNGGFRMEQYQIHRLSDLRIVDSSNNVDRTETVVKQVPERLGIPVNDEAYGSGLWTTGPPQDVNPFTTAEFVPRSSSLGLRVADPGNTFGYWNHDAIHLPLSANEEPALWINEVARVIDDPATGELERDAAWVEIAGPAGTSLDGWRLTAYTDTGSVKPLAQPNLSGTIPNLEDGYGAIRRELSYLETEEPYEAAIALALESPNGQLTQFISYNLTIEAAEGPAAGLVSQFTAAITDEQALEGRTIQLSGTGTRLRDFGWKHLSMPSADVGSNAQQAFSAYQTTWINELHHRNAGTDVNKGVEVAGLAGTNLAGWRLSYFDTDGVRVGGRNLTGVIPSLANGYGTIWFPAVTLPPDAGSGVALIDPNGFVVDFVGYGAALQAVSDVAEGLVALEIPAEPEDSDPNGSLQRGGFGVSVNDFPWQPEPLVNTRGRINTNQHIGTEVFRATFTLRNAQEIDPETIPTLRFRFGTTDFQRIAISSVLANGANASTTVPTTNGKRTYEVYMPLEGLPRNLTGLFVAYDILSNFDDRPVTPQVIELTDLKVERLLIPDYPAYP